MAQDKKPSTEYQAGTQCVQSGWQPQTGEPRVLPIIQSTTYYYESAEQMANLFDLKESGYFYTRLANPTNDAVAQKIAELEGGVGAILTSSGQAASFYSVFNIASAGDHVVCSSAIYGGTYNLFNVTMRRMGIDFTFIAPDCSDEELAAAFRPNTKLVFGESLCNPSLKILDIERFAQAAHDHQVPLIVDNTFPTPINLRPLEHGADVVIHSTTKYMDGHATSVGGCIVDGGSFDWAAAGKYPELTTPDTSYHGVIYTEAFGEAAYLTKILAQLMRDLGAIPSPHNSYLLNIGLETLHLRMERHCRNAEAVANYLAAHDKVTWVNYPSLAEGADRALVAKYLPHGSSGVVSFGVAGGRAAAAQFMEALDLAAIVTHVADARTSVLHPASTTHRQLSDDELLAAGVTPDLVRLSVGIEAIDDILADLDQALAQL